MVAPFIVSAIVNRVSWDLSIAHAQPILRPDAAPGCKGFCVNTLRYVLSRLLLVGLGVVVPLAMLEGGVRLLDLAPPPELQPPLWAPHPYLGWFHVPNRGGVVYSEYREFQAPVHINARGLRDDEIGYDKPAGTYRILVLGDSFAEALQVPLQETFVKQMQPLIGEPGRPAEVINGGVGGWGTDQEAIFYAIEGFRYQPDLVLLLLFAHNDVLNNYQPLEVARVHGAVEKPFFHLQDGHLVSPTFPFEPSPAPVQSSASLLPASEWLNGHVATYRLLAPYVREIPFFLTTLGPSGVLGGIAAFTSEDPQLPITYGIYRTDPGPDWEEAWRLTEAIIGRLNSEVRSHGGQLAVVIVGAPEQIYPARWSAVLTRYAQMQGESWDLDAPNRRLSLALDQAGIPYLDLLPTFREAAAQPGVDQLHFRHDGHWTMAGHRLVAQTVAEFVKRLSGR
jgi:lysophospholipase L1-like esterase